MTECAHRAAACPAAAVDITEAAAGGRQKARALRARREPTKRRQDLRHAARVLAAAQESFEAAAGALQEEAARHARDVLLANTTLDAQGPLPGAVLCVLHAPPANTEAAVGGRQQARVRRAQRGPTRRRQGLRHAARARAAVRESTEAAVGDRQQARAL